ncbi:MAG: hypothetical protein QM820_00375 [Minicystis sp.]
MGWEEVKYRWTNDDWAKAAAARKAKEDKVDPLPKIVVTPYGLSPFQLHTDGVEGGQIVIKARVYLASDTDAKKPLEAWDIPVGAEVMIPLELSRFGQRWMRDRFFKKGQAWIPPPDAAKGSTLGELCQSLYAMRDQDPRFDVYHFFSKTKPGANGGAPADKTPAEWDAEGPIRARILSKLVGHWKNTDYQFEQVRQGLPVNEALSLPLRSAAGAEVKLDVVLAESPPPAAPAAVAPQGTAGDAPGTGATVQPENPPGGTAPPPPFDKLPEPLKLTLVQSYQDRKDDKPEAARSLASYWHAAEGTTNVWQILNKAIDWQDLNTMVRVYQRIEAVDQTGVLWREHMKYIERATTGKIYELRLIYADQEKGRPKLTAYLDAITLRNTTPQLADASGFWQSEHGGTRGWREVSDTDQLHINVQDGTDPNATEDIHIDETSFTCGRDEKGKAVRMPLTRGIFHHLQSQEGWIDIDKPFKRLENMLKAPEDRRPLMNPDTAEALKQWGEVRGERAVSGEEGHKEAVKLLRRIEADEAERLPDPMSGPT